MADPNFPDNNYYSDPNAVPDSGGFVPNQSINPNGPGMSDVYGSGTAPGATNQTPANAYAGAPPVQYAPYMGVTYRGNPQGPMPSTPNPYAGGITQAQWDAFQANIMAAVNQQNQQNADQIRQQEQAAQDAANKAAQQAQANWQAQFDQTAKNQQNTLYSNLSNYLTNQLNTPMGPGLVNTLNASLTGLGLPGVGTSAGEGVLPNAITPAEWDALPNAIQQQILSAWQARGGDIKSFMASIDAQRPHGPQYTGGMVHYGNVAA